MKIGKNKARNSLKKKQKGLPENRPKPNWLLRVVGANRPIRGEVRKFPSWQYSANWKGNWQLNIIGTFKKNVKIERCEFFFF